MEFLRGVTIMEIFNIIAGISSILSLIISFFIASKVIKITNNITKDESIKRNRQTVKTRDNSHTTINQTGRDSR